MKCGNLLPFICNQTSGNPVKFGGGCATVTGYELPKPLIASLIGANREGGARLIPEVRIPV